MIFSDTTDRNGLIQECERICNLAAGGISSNSTLLKDFTVRLNSAIDRFYTLAFQYDSNWGIDDTNSFATQPTYLIDLVSGTQEYLIPTSLLVVEQVFAKDANGKWHELTAQDDRNAPNTFLTTTSGTPTKFKLHGNYILLDSIPNYSSSSGLKIIYKRTGVKFEYNDTAQTAGIPTIFESYLARYASYPYVLEKRLAHKNDLKREIMEDEAEIKTFIANRAKGKHSGMRIKQEDNR